MLGRPALTDGVKGGVLTEPQAERPERGVPGARDLWSRKCQVLEEIDPAPRKG